MKWYVQILYSTTKGSRSIKVGRRVESREPCWSLLGSNHSCQITSSGSWFGRQKCASDTYWRFIYVVTNEGRWRGRLKEEASSNCNGHFCFSLYQLFFCSGMHPRIHLRFNQLPEKWKEMKSLTENRDNVAPLIALTTDSNTHSWKKKIINPYITCSWVLSF